VKKAVNLGFLDFTTLEKRRFYCEKELKLNRRLCRGMYLEVVPINKSKLSVIKVKGEGETIEYAVKMKRIAQERILSTLLEKKEVSEDLIERIAKIIAEFHAKAKTNQRTSEFGSLAIIETNWKENFEQTEEFIGKIVTVNDFKMVKEKVEDFMKRNASLFEKRIRENHIKDCHGDIHSGNIFVSDKIYIFDAIEFNDRFRYSDVASDVAFLAMDLDFRERADRSDLLMRKYVEYSGDLEVMALLLFYKCYRAYVRGKVISFKLRDPAISREDKKTAITEAKAYFKLAGTYARILW